MQNEYALIMAFRVAVSLLQTVIYSAIVHASVPPSMEDGSVTIDVERFLALENTVRDLPHRVNYMDDYIVQIPILF